MLENIGVALFSLHVMQKIKSWIFSLWSINKSKCISCLCIRNYSFTSEIIHFGHPVYSNHIAVVAYALRRRWLSSISGHLGTAVARSTNPECNEGIGQSWLLLVTSISAESPREVTFERRALSSKYHQSIDTSGLSDPQT